MTTIRNILARTLRAILRGFAQTPYMGLCGPIPWLSQPDRDQSARDFR